MTEPMTQPIGSRNKIIVAVSAALGFFIILVGTVQYFRSVDAVDRSAEYIRDGKALYINTTKDVKFVGSDACRDCHLELYTAYMKTPTARSMYHLDTNNIIEDYPQKKPVYDPVLNFYYEMIRIGDKFYQREFRLDKRKRVIHERMMEAQYVIGSGKNLRMYFYDDNGMFYELPLTWYVHKKKWDLSPGYREFGNMRFSRYASSKCLACHNAHMDASPVSSERFLKPYPLGIGCESCHGPGDLHVRQTLGESVPLPSDDAKTIVNPVRLSPQRQIDVCQQCHLQGKAWTLRGDASWFDFRPGMLLEDLWSVYSYAAIHKEEFKVADSGFRFSLSRCYQESHGVTTCNSCHDSHGMFRGSVKEFNRQNCQKCHPPESLSGLGSTYVHRSTDDCVSCHMKQTGMDNTLHGVVNTDHWIRVDANTTTIDWTFNRTPHTLLPLQTLVPALDAKDSGALTRKGMALLDYYKNEDHRPAYLDSAQLYLSKGLTVNPNDPRGLLALGEARRIMMRYGDALTSFRKALALRSAFPEVYFQIGATYAAQGMRDSAIANYRTALTFRREEPLYLEHLGMALADAGQHQEALKTLLEARRIDKQNPAVLAYLGKLYALAFQDPMTALPYFRERTILDPDAADAFVDLGNTLALLGDYDGALQAYLREIDYHPGSASAMYNLQRTYAFMQKEGLVSETFRKTINIDSVLSVVRSK